MKHVYLKRFKGMMIAQYPYRRDYGVILLGGKFYVVIDNCSQSNPGHMLCGLPFRSIKDAFSFIEWN
jgi:hypothetical protein